MQITAFWLCEKLELALKNLNSGLNLKSGMICGSIIKLKGLCKGGFDPVWSFDSKRSIVIAF